MVLCMILSDQSFNIMIGSGNHSLGKRLINLNINRKKTTRVASDSFYMRII